MSISRGGSRGMVHSTWRCEATRTPKLNRPSVRPFVPAPPCSSFQSITVTGKTSREKNHRGGSADGACTIGTEHVPLVGVSRFARSLRSPFPSPSARSLSLSIARPRPRFHTVKSHARAQRKFPRPRDALIFDDRSSSAAPVGVVIQRS